MALGEEKKRKDLETRCKSVHAHLPSVLRSVPSERWL